MNKYCSVCGDKSGNWINKKIISDNLAKEWMLTKSQRDKIDLRESQFCSRCNSSFRTRALAEAVMKKIPYKGVTTLEEWVRYANRDRLRVAEINSCGGLHKVLKNLIFLSYSEYQPALLDKNLITTLKNIIKKIMYRYRHEDITALSYKTNTFDLVLHSETLEHIVNVKKALSETRRILKPAGYCIFTIPIIPERVSKQRVDFGEDSNYKYLENNSYHGFGNKSDYLVCWEFGGDFIKKNTLEVIFSSPKFMTWVLANKR